MTEVNVTEENIPGQLRPIKNWICWREGERDGKPTKIPTKPYATSGSPNLDVTDPSQRRDFETALESLNDTRVDADGLGFVFTDGVSITGVDLDKCRDPETGELEDWAEDIINRLDSYTEISPSGTGIHILVGGNLPPGGNRKDTVEMYDTDRYFTVTGAHLEGTPKKIRKCQKVLERVHRDYIQEGRGDDGQTSLAASAQQNQSEDGENSADHEVEQYDRSQSALHRKYGSDLPHIEDDAVREALYRVDDQYLPAELPSTLSDLAGPGVDLSDEEILERMFNSKGGDRKRQLFDGDPSMFAEAGAKYPSQSEADMAFAHTLAFWTGKDPDRMDALFRKSGLHRTKWDTPHYSSGATYGGVTIARALLRVDDYYELPYKDGSQSSQRSSRDEREDPGHSFGGANGASSGTEDLVDTVEVEPSPDTADTPASSESAHDVPGGASATQGDAGGVEPSRAASESSPSLHTDGQENDSELPPEDTTFNGVPQFDDPDVISDYDDGGTTSTPSGSDTPRSVTDDDGDATAEAGATTTRTTAPGADTATEGPDAASPQGVDTDSTLRDSTQRSMADTAAKAGPDWERTNPYQKDDEKHPNDWTIPREGRSPTEQALNMAREDNRILARKLRRQAGFHEELRELEEECDRYEFTAEVYLRAIDELMGERNRYRAALKNHGLLTVEEEALPDDSVERLKQIITPLIREEDTRTTKETISGLDAILAEYTEENELRRMAEEERKRRGGLRGALSRLVRGD